MRELLELRFWRNSKEKKLWFFFHSRKKRYLRCGNDVNNAVGILSKDLSARNLPVPFGVW